MWNSAALWTVSAVISIAVHAGLLSAIGRIDLSTPPAAPPAEVIVSGGGTDLASRIDVSPTTPNGGLLAAVPGAAASAPSGAQIAATGPENLPALEASHAASLETANGNSVTATAATPSGATPVEAAKGRSADMVAAATASGSQPAAPSGGDVAAASPSGSPLTPAVESNTAAQPQAGQGEITAADTGAGVTVPMAYSGPATAAGPRAGSIATAAPLEAANGNSVTAAIASGSQPAAPSGSDVAAASPSGSPLTPAGESNTASLPQAGPGEITAADTGAGVTAPMANSGPATTAGPDAGSVAAVAPQADTPRQAPGAGSAVQATTGLETPAADDSALLQQVAGTEVQTPQGDAIKSIDATPEVSDAAGGSTTGNGAGTQVAGIPTAVRETLTQSQKIERFLEAQKSTPCLYAKPDDPAAGHPALAGFGLQGAAISGFADAFRQAVGIDATIAIRPIVDAQCPVVDFLRAFAARGFRDLTVVIDSDTITDGGMLAGHLDGKLGDNVSLLLVDDDGSVHDISSTFQRGKTKNFFALQVGLKANGAGRNQMLMAFSSQAIIAIGAQHEQGEAGRVFAALAQQLTSAGGGFAFDIKVFTIK